MRIIFNEKHIETGSGTLLELMSEMEMSGKTGIAVAVNDHVVPRAQWQQKGVHENDTVIVITAAAGG